MCDRQRVLEKMADKLPPENSYFSCSSGCAAQSIYLIILCRRSHHTFDSKDKKFRHGKSENVDCRLSLFGEMYQKGG